MKPDARDAAYLWDMLEHARAVTDFVSGKSYRDYLNDRMFRGAVERYIEVIGEAARKVSQPFKSAHPQVPWKGIVAQRNVLAHEYGDVEDELIWDVATRHIPKLIVLIECLTPPIPPELNDGPG